WRSSPVADARHGREVVLAALGVLANAPDDRRDGGEVGDLVLLDQLETRVRRDASDGDDEGSSGEATDEHVRLPSADVHTPLRGRRAPSDVRRAGRSARGRR